ncbi:MAG: multidrug ABC transporter [Lachnospiraceae bacterium]|nr:multidrug ABC transporter [Lachnospiraceae bacterium]
MNIYVLISLTGVTIASFSQVILKKSSGKQYPNKIREYLNPLVIVGYGMMFIALGFSLVAFTGLEFTNIPLLESAGYIIIMFLGYFFFKEKITMRKLLGMALIFAGYLVYFL